LYPSEKESNQVKHPRFSPAVYLFVSWHIYIYYSP
jgi:hypothetical protein